MMIDSSLLNDYGNQWLMLYAELSQFFMVFNWIK
ncbi:Uncharacterised protein [Oligella ureolytica]|uniref:Uncharacterized protein n=1 Tax=Oligella ureolytica TaxID=90244 RepID=A0A378XE44_9BURK|nr:Uncharacterised protein [Oligella ureolytica]